MSSRGRMRHPVLAGLLGVLVLLIVAVGVLVATFDPRPRIEAAVASATGRQVAINGPVRLGLFPPSVTLHDVTLANPPGFSQPQMATVRTITLRVDLGALLHRDIVVRQLILDGPAITLERNKAGAANWEFARAAQPETAGSASPGTRRPTSLALLDAQLHDGVIRYRDDRGGQSVTVTLPHLALTGAGADAPVHLAGEAVVDGTAVTLAADAPGLTKPFPLRLAVQAAGARASATVTESANAISLADLRIATPGGDLTGTADVAFAPRPALHAVLSGTRIDLSALPRPATPSAPPSAPAAPAPAPARPSTAKTSPAAPSPRLPVSALRDFDADLRLTLQELAGGGQSLHGVALQTKVAGGALSVVGHATYAGSPVDLTAVADTKPATPTLAVALNAPALPAATVLAALGKPGFIAGNIAVAANLHGAGQTQHALVGSLDGFGAATMTGGRINARVLERALGPAIARANPLGALGGAESDIKCLAVRANVAHGVATLAPLLLSSEMVTIDGGGTVDLANGTLDLHLQPQGRAGGIGFSVPMTVRGSWSDPHVAVSNAGAAAAGVRAALELLAGRGAGGTRPAAPACGEALAAARR